MPPSSPEKAKKKSSAQRRGNAAQAFRVRISDVMTVTQLQDECRHRDINGLSGKNKTWLLDQLGVGTVWKSHPLSANAKNGAKAKKSPVASASSKTDGKPKPKPVSTKKITKKENPKPKKIPTAEAKKGSAAQTQSKSKSKSSFDQTRAPPANGPTTVSLSNFWSDAPRITSKATNPQLSHELLKRDPLATGLSGKPKSWFVSKLGENSVWTTNEGMKQHTDKLIKAPLVTNSLTKGQLMHEIMTRTPGIKGLSSKSKDDLLSTVAVGSIWTTGHMTTTATATDTNATSQPPPAKRAKVEKKKTPKRE